VNINQILPSIAVALLVATVLFTILKKPKAKNWVWPLLLSGSFFAYSVYTISVEGIFGFWLNHTRDFWGNQIWFDLLIGIGTAFLVLLDRVRAQRMNPVLWFVVVLAVGSIGLLAMVSRLLFLEARKTGK
jgi:hypothetical protein